MCSIGPVIYRVLIIGPVIYLTFADCNSTQTRMPCWPLWLYLTCFVDRSSHRTNHIHRFGAIERMK